MPHLISVQDPLRTISRQPTGTATSNQQKTPLHTRKEEVLTTYENGKYNVKLMTETKKWPT